MGARRPSPHLPRRSAAASWPPGPWSPSRASRPGRSRAARRAGRATGSPRRPPATARSTGWRRPRSSRSPPRILRAGAARASSSPARGARLRSAGQPARRPRRATRPPSAARPPGRPPRGRGRRSAPLAGVLRAQRLNHLAHRKVGGDLFLGQINVDLPPNAAVHRDCGHPVNALEARRNLVLSDLAQRDRVVLPLIPICATGS